MYIYIYIHSGESFNWYFFNLIFNELSDSVHLMGKGNNYPPPTIRDLFFCWLAFSMVS